MSTTQLRIVSTGLFFVFIFLFGYWLNRTGKPYGALLFNIHKLIAVGAVVYLAVTLNKIHPITSLGPVQITVIGVTALCFLVTILTGGLVSIEKTVPAYVHKLHQFLPYLTVLSTAASLYLVRG